MSRSQRAERAITLRGFNSQTSQIDKPSAQFNNGWVTVFLPSVPTRTRRPSPGVIGATRRPANSSGTVRGPTPGRGGVWCRPRAGTLACGDATAARSAVVEPGAKAFDKTGNGYSPPTVLVLSGLPGTVSRRCSLSRVWIRPIPTPIRMSRSLTTTACPRCQRA